MNPKKPVFDAFASLHFLPSGDYLFVDYTGGQRAKFLTVETVAAAFTSLGIDTGWIPAGLVRHGHGPRGPWYVYSAPAQKVEIVLQDRRFEVPVPRTVLLHVGRTAWVWALKTSSFDPDALAFAVPLPNVHGDGKVCWGQNTAPDANPSKARAAWQMFFDTPFNLDLENRKSLAHPNDVTVQLAAQEGKSKYPLADLVPMSGGKKIAELIDAHIKE